MVKFGKGHDGKPAQFCGIRLYLHSAEELHHTPEDERREAEARWSAVEGADD